MKNNLKGALLWWSSIPIMLAVMIYGIHININWIIAPLLGITFVSIFGIKVYTSNKKMIEDMR